MSARELPVHEANPWKTPLRNLGLTIHGTPLEQVLRDFLCELKQRDLARIEPKFYLSTEWGVPFGTISIAIPFYLARADLTKARVPLYCGLFSSHLASASSTFGIPAGRGARPSRPETFEVSIRVAKREKNTAF
jgi:hypothetical protein